MTPSTIPTTGGRALAWLCGGILACLLQHGTITNAVAQGFGPDPYRPYNSRYDAFVYPIAPGPLDYGVNQGFSPTSRIGVRGANQFEEYMNSVRGKSGGGRSGSGRGANSGSPHARTDRSFDREYDKIYEYRPNRQADKRFERFEADQEQVSDLYFRYLRERDPKKRADIFREYSKAKQQAERDLTGNAAPKSTAARRNRGDAPPPIAGASSARSRTDAPSPTGEPAGSRPSSGRADRTRRTPAAGAAPSPLDDDMPAGDLGTGGSRSRPPERSIRTGPEERRPARPRSTPSSDLGPPPAP